MDAEQIRKRQRRLVVRASRERAARFVQPGASNPLATVARDATSSWYLPASTAQWDTLLSVAGSSGAPIAILLSQEASGNLADSSGNSITFTASGTGISYAQTVSGWTAKGISITNGATGLFASTSASLPDISTTSCAVFSIGQLTLEPGTFRNIHGLGTATRVSSFLKAGPELQMFADANGTTLSGVDPLTAVRIFITQIDRSGNAERLITNQEALTPTFAATPTGKSVEIIGGPNGAAQGTWIYHAVFSGTAAQKSVATWKTIMTTIGATVSY